MEKFNQWLADYIQQWESRMTAREEPSFDEILDIRQQYR